jgi:dTDP-4-dehydrorhamnose reductase
MLEKEFSVVPEGEPCDVLVNCAGFSRMYEAKQNPNRMKIVENAVFDRIVNIQFDQLIHLSTIHVDSYPEEPYSQIKKGMENRIRMNYPDALILRLGSVIGSGLQKNALYDLVHDEPLWVTEDSRYTYISTEDVAKIIIELIRHPLTGLLYVGGSGSVSVKEMAELMGKHPASYGSIQHIIPMDVSRLLEFYPVKTSREYVEEYWKGYRSGQG